MMTLKDFQHWRYHIASLGDYATANRMLIAEQIIERLDRLTELVEKLGEQQHQRNYGHPEERP